MSNNGTDTVRFIKNPHGNVVSTSNNDKMIILQKQVIVTLLKLNAINKKYKKKEGIQNEKNISKCFISNITYIGNDGSSICTSG